MSTITTPADLRAAALASLDRLLDMTAELGLAVACRSPDPATLAGVLAAAEAACKSLEACRAALPAEDEQEVGDAAGRRGGPPGAAAGAGAQRVAVLRHGRALPSIPTAAACSQARCHASAWFPPRAKTWFSPLLPITSQEWQKVASPTHQPAARRRRKDSSGLG
jgi:hypothetical protein